MSELFGWDLIYKVSEEDLFKKEDVLVLLVHYLLIKSGYRCIGLGDEKTLTGNEASSETLPTGWSRSNCYALRYVANNQLFILRVISSNDSIVFNFLQVTTLAVSTVAFDQTQSVASLKGKIGELVPDYETVIQKIKRELLEPVKVPVNKEATTQTAQHPRSSSSVPAPPPNVPSPLHVQPSPLRIPGPANVDPFWNDPERDPLRVGQRDLDPLGVGGGGGMIFNPFQPHGHGIPDPGLGVPGGLPRGAIPPGARFDPFGPPGFPDRPHPRPPPDADHMPPPGFGGMFM